MEKIPIIPIGGIIFPWLLWMLKNRIFFLGKNEFREVEKTGIQKLGRVTQLSKGKIYSNGNLDFLEKSCGIKAGNSVLYVGDHIFSDVMISKKKNTLGGLYSSFQN